MPAYSISASVKAVFSVSLRSTCEHQAIPQSAESARGAEISFPAICFSLHSFFVAIASAVV